MSISESYKEIIQRCAKNDENFVISNGHASHATFLFKTFFEKAQSEICVLSGQLYEEVFDNNELINQAISFLEGNKERTLKIAFRDNVPPTEILNRGFVKALISKPEIKDQIKIWNASASCQDIISNHFAVIDAKAFRFEIDHENRKAIANFGDKKSAETLDILFDLVVSQSEKVTIP
ncbi:MAG: hypothetical protein LUQ65_09430 [Candidatus Helarchaeota archaeon]|nr:hypothetical protein [Candidatus Helarchaeota archaeon]